MVSTQDLMQSIRADIKRELREEILKELEPEIKKRLFGNTFNLMEAAQYLKVSGTTLRKMVKDGEIPHFVQRGQYFFRQTDLDKNISSKIRSGPQVRIRKTGVKRCQ